MSFFAASAIVNAITSILLGFLVLSRRPKDPIHLLFSLFAFSVAGWSLAYFFWQLADSESIALLWVRIQMAVMIFIPFFYFHFVSLFLGITKEKRLVTAAAYVFGTGFLLVTNFTSLFIADVAPRNGFEFWPVAGPFFIPFLAIWGFYIIYATFYLLQHLWNTTGIKRYQIQYLLVGTTVGYIGGATNFFLWYNELIPTIGNTLISFYVVMVSYAILKHHLFHIKVIATELLVFALWVFLFMQTLLAETPEQQITQGAILGMMMVVGVLLIRSVVIEVQARQESETLAHDLQLANKKLREIDERKSESISVASHQLRSPVAAIKGYASLILEGSFGDPRPAVKEAVQKIFDASNDMARSVSDFLDVTRLEEGRIEYKMAVSDLTGLVAEVVEEVSPIAHAKGLDLVFEPPENRVFARIDREKMKQVLLNLLDNATKYTREGDIVVRFSLETEHHRTTISVADTGVGMSERTLRHLFERFSRADNAMLENVYGTGLGLYIAKQFVEAHHGTITAHSSGEGKGSIFSVTLPIVER